MDLPPMTTLAGAPPLPGSLEWTATVLGQMNAESAADGPAYAHPADVHHDGHTPRYAVRFHSDTAPGYLAAYARLTCGDCGWSADWHRARRTWAGAWSTLAVWAAVTMADHDEARHLDPPREGPITAATPRVIQWWQR